jgi:hypothetical protein
VLGRLPPGAGRQSAEPGLCGLQTSEHTAVLMLGNANYLGLVLQHPLTEDRMRR